MFANLLKYSYRALKRQRSYVIINVFGLAVGMLCSLVIALFIIHELSYDRFHEKGDRTYQVILRGKIGGQEARGSYTASPIGPAMKNEFPEVEDFVRVNAWGETILRDGDRSFTEKSFIEADSTFFSFFSIPLIRGNREDVLSEPHTLVLSENTARRMFGEEDPVGRMLRVGSDSALYRVTGVMAEIPGNSHMEANAIGSFMTNRRANDGRWTSNSFNTYVLLYPGSTPEQAEARVPDLIYKYVGPEITRYLGISMEEFFSQGNEYTLELQKLTGIHLNPSVEQMLKPANDPKYLLIFGSIGVLIIIIASVNFMNLSTAQAAKRAKEVGIKKVSGSTREMLIAQFLTESVVISLFALLLAVAATELTLPLINDLLEIRMETGFFTRWFVLPAVVLVAVVIGLLAGIYPAFFLSSFTPYSVLKGGYFRGKGSGRLRNILVVLQFSISILLIIGTFIMFRQLNFMMNKQLGFDKENVMVISRAESLGNKVKSFKTELLAIPGVLKVSASTAVPGNENNNNAYMIKGRPEESFLLQTNWVDEDYLATYGFELADGRFFDKSYSTDHEMCILNECAVRDFQITDPFSADIVTFEGNDEEKVHKRVIGVVRDFHYESLRSRIGPYIMRYKGDGNFWGYVSVRLSPDAGAQALSRIEQAWGSFTGNDPMQYFFMENDLRRLYKEERQNSRLAILFTLLGILVASLGLYGLTSFNVQQRTKEIGVRKTFGASVANIWYLIARDILLLVAIAALISMPFTYWIADNWLQNYQYRISLHAYDFLLGFIIAAAIALLTISYRAIRAARMNPVDPLRHE